MSSNTDPNQIILQLSQQIDIKRNQIERLENEIQVLENARNSIEDLRGERRAEYAHHTLVDALIDALESEGQPRSAAFLADLVRSRGLPTKAKDFKNNVIVTLNKHSKGEQPLFERHGKSRWKLVHWQASDAHPDAFFDERHDPAWDEDLKIQRFAFD